MPDINIDPEDVYRIGLNAEIAQAMKKWWDSLDRQQIDQHMAYAMFAAIALEIALPRHTDHIAEMISGRAPTTAARTRSYARFLRSWRTERPEDARGTMPSV
jgi:hypothetical protein